MTKREELKQQIEKIKKDYQKQPIITELAKKYNCSASTMTRFLQEYKIHNANPFENNIKYKKLHNNILEFERDYKDGVLSLKELEEKYEAPLTAIKGVARNKGWERPSNYEKIDKTLLIKEYVNREKHVKDILKQFNITYTTLRKILNENGIEEYETNELKRTYKFDETFFDEINTPEKAYMLGFIYADGGINEERNTLTITIQEQDVGLLIRFTELTQNEKPLRDIFNKQYNKIYKSFNIQSIKLIKQLKKLGLMENKSFKIKFPNFLREDLYKYFIRGYFDGDGYISYVPGKFQHAHAGFCGNKEFIQELLLKIKELSGLNFNFYLINKETGFSEISKGGRFQLKKFFEWIYDDDIIYLERKYNKSKNFLKENDEYEQSRKNKKISKRIK